MGQLAEATFVQRLSGTFIAKDIDELLDKLMEFEKNTTVRSLLESSLCACRLSPS